MANGFSGGFKELERWRRQIEQAGSENTLRKLNAVLAEETLTLIADGFRKSKTPTGRRWKPKKRPDGRKILVGKTARLRNGWHRSQIGPESFTVSPSVDYAKYHQTGTRRGLVPRQMIPDGNRLPSRWDRAFQETAEDFLEAQFRG